jgi:signal transduction histidine kinase
VRNALHRIVRDGTRAGEVIARIRALLKKGEPVRSPLTINEVIQETLGFVQPGVEEHKVQVGTDLSTNLPPVLADRVQVQQVLLNLFINAIDALQEVTQRPRLLHIRTDQEEPGKVRVAVQDSGPGIDPAQADRLFKTFFTTKPQGLGMGLAISRSIIEAHGGHLWSTPNGGPGITFLFTLPACAGGAP